MCRVGKWQWIPERRLLLLLKVTFFFQVCRHAKQTLCQNEISRCDSSTPSSNWAPFLFHCTHPIWVFRAPAAWWLLTIASLPFIKCWNDTFPHRRYIIRQASGTQLPLLGLNMPALITQSRLSTLGYWMCLRWEGEVCVWHVNSNQGSDIHQTPWQTVRINLWKKDSQALFFVSVSNCRCLSHIHTSRFAVYHCLPVFSFSSIYLSLFYLITLSLFHSGSLLLSVFSVCPF